MGLCIECFYFKSDNDDICLKCKSLHETEDYDYFEYDIFTDEYVNEEE